jgi:hypothetical protein
VPVVLSANCRHDGAHRLSSASSTEESVWIVDFPMLAKDLSRSDELALPS